MVFLLAAPVWALFLYSAGFGMWVLLTDYVGLFRRRMVRDQPADLQLLQRGFVRAAKKERIEKQKEHLRESCEVHGHHIQRNSHLGLSSHPLTMKE